MSLVLFFLFFVTLTFVAVVLKAYESLDDEFLSIVGNLTLAYSEFVNETLEYSHLRSKSYDFFVENRNKRFILAQDCALSNTKAKDFVLTFVNVDTDYAEIEAGLFNRNNTVSLVELLGLIESGKVVVTDYLPGDR